MRDVPYHLQPSNQAPRVALVYRDNREDAVSHVGLGVSAGSTAKTLRQHGIWTEVWPTRSAEQLLARLRATHESANASGDARPTHVVIAAPWIPTKDLAGLAAAFPEVAFVVVSHSSVGFLGADPHAIQLLRETADLQLATHNVFLGGNATKFTDWATVAWGVNAVWLPNLYCLAETFPQLDQRWDGGELRLGLFGANRTLKNFISGAAAAVELARRLRVPVKLFLSSGRDEGGDAEALNEMTDHIANLEVTRSGWLAWPEFRQLLRTVHLVFQPSFTETFNVVTADAISEGVPVVTSPAIDWVPTWWQANPDDPGEIARVAEQLLRSPDAAKQGRAALQTYVTQGLAAWTRFLVPTLAPHAALGRASHPRA